MKFEIIRCTERSRTLFLIELRSLSILFVFVEMFSPLLLCPISFLFPFADRFVFSNVVVLDIDVENVSFSIDKQEKAEQQIDRRLSFGGQRRANLFSPSHPPSMWASTENGETEQICRRYWSTADLSPNTLCRTSFNVRSISPYFLSVPVGTV